MGFPAEETSVAVYVYGEDDHQNGEHGPKNDNTSRGEFRLHSGDD